VRLLIIKNRTYKKLLSYPYILPK